MSGVAIDDDLGDASPIDPTPLAISSEYVSDLVQDILSVRLGDFVKMEFFSALPSPGINEA